MAKKKLYAYDSYSDKDQSRRKEYKTWAETFSAPKGLEIKDNPKEAPRSTRKVDPEEAIRKTHKYR